MMTRALVLFVASLAAVLPTTTECAPAGVIRPSADTCSFRPVFESGRRLTYTFKSTTELYAGPSADASKAPSGAPERAYVTELTIRLGVLGIDDKGGASLALVIERAALHSAHADMERAGEWTSDKAGAAEPPAETAPLEERLAYVLAKAAARIDVRPDGSVAGVQGLEEAQAIAKSGGVEGSRLLGPLAAGADARTLALLFRADTPRDQGFPSRAVGDSWEFSDRVPMAGVGALLLTSSLTLNACSGAEARASGIVRTSVEPARNEDGTPADPDPTRPVLSVDGQTDTLSVVWDTQHGALKKRERDSYISMSAKIGATRQHVQTVKTRSTIELTQVTPPSP